MTGTASRRVPVPAWTLAVASMFSVQLGSALSVHLISAVGAAGTAWLRLTLGGLIFLAVSRPPLRAIGRGDLLALLGLGIVTGLQTIAFLAAIARIPLGTAVAVEFLGPLTVAAVHSRSLRALVWPAMALTGVVLLSQPWRGTISFAGLAFAAASGLGWAVYILLTQHVGSRFAGVSALSMTIPVAALTAAIPGITQAAGHLTAGLVVAAAGLAVLLPVLPYAFELLALRRMQPSAFGTLMALEPAFGVVLGLIVLHQTPSLSQLAGILLVVLAGAAAQRVAHGSGHGQGAADGALGPSPELSPVPPSGNAAEEVDDPPDQQCRSVRVVGGQ